MGRWLKPWWPWNPNIMPNGRAATWGYSRLPAACASAERSIISRHNFGSASTWISANDTGRSISPPNRRIQSSSFFGATMSSPADPCGASSNTAWPPAAMARPRPNSSSSAANVPGTGSPSIARCPIVRDVENPSAPASIASVTSRPIAAMSSGVAGSLRAPRSPIAYARMAPCATWLPTSTANFCLPIASRYSG